MKTPLVINTKNPFLERTGSRPNVANLFPVVFSKEMGGYDQQLAGELRKAFAEKRIKGMVVKTRIDAAENVIDDPSFIVNELTEIGEKTF